MSRRCLQQREKANSTYTAELNEWNKAKKKKHILGFMAWSLKNITMSLKISPTSADFTKGSLTKRSFLLYNVEPLYRKMGTHTYFI